MQKLNKIITGDIFNNDHWSQLKKNLTEVMGDPDEELSVCFPLIHLKTLFFFFNLSR